MAALKIHDYLKKRDLLNNPELPQAEAKKWADACLDAGLIHDAFEFYKKAGNMEGLEKILKFAEEEGDFFLVDCALKALNRSYTTGEWLKLAQKAEKLNKYLFASQAYKMAGKDDEVARLMFLNVH